VGAVPQGCGISPPMSPWRGAIANGPIFREAASAAAGDRKDGQKVRACKLKTGSELQLEIFETDFKVGSGQA